MSTRLEFGNHRDREADQQRLPLPQTVGVMRFEFQPRQFESKDLLHGLVCVGVFASVLALKSFADRCVRASRHGHRASCSSLLPKERKFPQTRFPKRDFLWGASANSFQRTGLQAAKYVAHITKSGYAGERPVLRERGDAGGVFPYARPCLAEGPRYHARANLGTHMKGTATD